MKCVKCERVFVYLLVKLSGVVMLVMKVVLVFVDVDEVDYCETSFRAYRDVESFLFNLVKVMKKEKKML